MLTCETKLALYLALPSNIHHKYSLKREDRNGLTMGFHRPLTRSSSASPVWRYLNSIDTETMLFISILAHCGGKEIPINQRHVFFNA